MGFVSDLVICNQWMGAVVHDTEWPSETKLYQTTSTETPSPVRSFTFRVFHLSAENISVYNLKGSIFKWANEGRPVVDSSGQAVSKVHPYSAVWGKCLNSELRASVTKL